MPNSNSNSNSAQNTVYIVWGLGFGDDEEVWELCGVFATEAQANAEKASILQDTGLDDSDVRVTPEQVQQ